MSSLYDMKMAIERIASEQGLDSAKVGGQISLRSGVLLALVKPTTPDDPAKLEKLRAAALAILKVDV